MSLTLTTVFKLRVVKVLVASSVFLFSACVTGSEEDKLRLEQQQVYSQMEEMLVDRSCATVSDCGIMPVGSMACGGPASYMAYAIAIGEDKISQLKEMSERSKQLDKKLNALSQMMSPCVYHSAPSLVCEDNQCGTRYEPSNPIGIPSDVE